MAARPVPSIDRTLDRQVKLAAAVRSEHYISDDVCRLARALPHMLPVGTRTQMPGFWDDFEVRCLLIAAHRQMTLDQVRSLLLDAVGHERAPSRSAVGRFWKTLDQVRRG